MFVTEKVNYISFFIAFLHRIETSVSYLAQGGASCSWGENTALKTDRGRLPPPAGQRKLFAHFYAQEGWVPRGGRTYWCSWGRGPGRGRGSARWRRSPGHKAQAWWQRLVLQRLCQSFPQIHLKSGHIPGKVVVNNEWLQTRFWDEFFTRRLDQRVCVAVYWFECDFTSTDSFYTCHFTCIVLHTFTNAQSQRHVKPDKFFPRGRAENLL